MASTADVSVRIAGCTGDDVPAVRSFFARVYGDRYALCDPELMRWQFQRPPAGDGQTWHLMLAFDGAAIVGCLGCVPLDVDIGGRTGRGAWVINWMVDPAHRHLGLGPLMMREVVRRFDVTLNAGPNPAARQMLARMGWWSYGDLPRHVAVLDETAARMLTAAGELSWPKAPLEAARTTDPVSSGVVTCVDRFDDSATRLWERLRASRPMAGTRRSASFLNWRYADHPVFRYRMFVERDNGEITGLAVYRLEDVRDTPVRVARLVEYLEEDRGEPSRSALLGQVLADARSAGAAMMDYFCGDRGQTSRFAQHGFLDDPETIANVPVLFQPIDRGRTGIWFMVNPGREADTASTMHWYVTKGDADQDRPS